MYYELTDKFIVGADLARTWAFFSDAANLPKITPPGLKFRVHTPMPVEMCVGTDLDYTIRWMGIPFRWRTRIIDWAPPHSFIDLQTRGPYTLWLHQHSFTESDDGTLCRDRVVYKVPLGRLGRGVHALRIRKQLKAIFRYRRRIIAEHLGWLRELQPDIRIAKL